MLLPLLLEHHCEHSADQGGSQRRKNLGYFSTVAGVTGALAFLDIGLVEVASFPEILRFLFQAGPDNLVLPFHMNSGLFTVV